MIVDNPYNCLIPLIKKKAIETNPILFHKGVNEVFHNIEAEFYDSIHKNMWQSLPIIFEKLASKLVDLSSFNINRTLKLLDIGSGTGLSTELILNSTLGDQIKNITLLDSSYAMIEKSKQRAASWKVADVKFVTGYLDQIHDKYDIVLCSSLLHHIPDLGQFLLKISEIQNPGSYFIHLQDPNSSALQSSVYKKRNNDFKVYKTQRIKQNQTIFNKLKARLYIFRKKLFGTDYVSRVNKELKRLNIIKKSLTASEIWSVTDIHVENLPYSVGEGISIKQIGNYLVTYQNIYNFSYSFFGPLSYELPEDLKAEENKLLFENDKFGRNIAGIWEKQ